MKVEPSEIDHVEDAGEMDGSPVKLIRTKGGFWLAIGRPLGKTADTALSAGSHPAIVKYNVEKMYSAFRPALMKSIMFHDEAFVQKHTKFLPEDLRKSGYDIFSIQTGSKVEFQVTHQNMKIAGVTGMLKNQELEISNLDFTNKHLKGLASAVAEKAMQLNVGFRLK